jgi:hypothetical protein
MLRKILIAYVGSDIKLCKNLLFHVLHLLVTSSIKPPGYRRHGSKLPKIDQERSMHEQIGAGYRPKNLKNTIGSIG